MSKKTEERLEELLEDKEEELDELREKVEELEGRLETLGDTPRAVPPSENPALPVPRLELLYTASRNRRTEQFDWGSYTVTYRLVYRHYLGHLDWTLFTWTRIIQGGVARRPLEIDGQPNTNTRLWHHIHHDSMKLGLPTYFVIWDSPTSQTYGELTIDGPDIEHIKAHGSRMEEKHKQEQERKSKRKKGQP